MKEKAACVWLFIRARDKCKGAIAQYISQTIKKQCEMKKKGENIEKEFVYSSLSEIKKTILDKE